MNAISLFSGIGGLDLAASANGFDIVAQVEIDPYCRKILKAHKNEHWIRAKTFTDVRNFGKRSIKTGTVDLIFGGFPCQPFSISGSRKGKDDSRNMWPEFKRIISEFKPRAVLLENVPAICNPFEVERLAPSSGTNRFTRVRRRRLTRPAYALTVIKDLSEMGYVCQWGIVSARDAGAAHLRERWWLVAYAEDIGINRREWFKRNDTNRPIDNVRETSNHRDKVLVNATGTGLEGRNRGQSEQPNITRFGRGNIRNIFEPRLDTDADGLPVWLVEYQRPALINELPDCAQFPHEPPRTIAQKAPDHKDAIKACGNAVFVPTAFWLFKALASELRAD